MRALSLMVGLPLLLGAGSPTSDVASSSATSVEAAAHDLHVAYADVAIEGTVMAVRLRIFKDDLEQALGREFGVDALQLTPGPEADALVLRYLRRHLNMSSAGVTPTPEILRSGEDLLDREPIWWAVVQYETAGAVEEIDVRNTILLDSFEDQRNVMKFVRFPEQTARTYYFARGEEERRVSFD